ncbi:MAG: hypothetical protein AAFN77_07275 [Planctomycetota bacterium]
MAILWSAEIDGNRYEVRTAGASLRLYRNGVHHSQFNPNRPLSGGIWDLLTITALYREPATIDRGLILGFGAGAAGRLLRELVEPTGIVGIDMDPVHLSIADGFFDCGQGCELIAADAVDWVNQTTSDREHRPTFDWVLDDLYGEVDSIPVRVGPTSLKWFRNLSKLVADDGMLVVNLVEPDEVKSLPIFHHREMIRRFPHAVELSMQAYDNRVLALSRKPFVQSELKQRLKGFLQRFPACRGVQKKYRIKSIRR